MKQLPHIVSKLFNEPALITPARHGAICQIVESHLGGFTAPQPLALQPMKKFYPQYGQYQEGEDNEGILYTKELRTVGDTAIIAVHGTLVPHPEDLAMSECGCSTEELNTAISIAEHDPRIKRMIFDFRTPGGTVTGVPETGNRIRNSSKETIAFTDSECCSGGIWLASQCQRFYATQSSRVGSVGVYTMCLDMSASLKKEGVKINAIFAGKYKLLGAYWKPLADDERDILQKRVDKIYAQFKEAMEAYRVVNDEHFGNGLVFDGDEAAEIGFIDGVVESLDDILENMVE